MTDIAPHPAQRGFAPLRAVRAAFVFLTRIPVGGFPYSANDWRWAPAHFPFVGIVIGALSAAAYWSFARTDETVAALLAVTVSVLFTGAFHEDGLADTSDALGGAHGPKSLFEILKDSRIGTYGAVALVLSLGLRVATLSALGNTAIPALILSHALARTGPVWMIALVPYAAEVAAKSTLVGAARYPQAFGATLWSLLALLTALYFRAASLNTLLTASALVALASVALSFRFKARAGGITGDFLGATEQVSEVLVLLAFLAFAKDL